MKRIMFAATLCCLTVLTVAAQPQGNADSWVYMTAEDFVNDNRQFTGEYTVAPAKGESKYKDSLKIVYTPARIDGDKKSDVSKNAWAVISDGQLYLGNDALGGGAGFSKAFSTGRYNLFFTVINDSGSSQKKYGYQKDDVRFYEKLDGKSRGSLNVGGIAIGMGSTAPMFVPVVIDRTNGIARVWSQAFMQELGEQCPAVAAPPMNKARGAALIEYFREINAQQ